MQVTNISKSGIQAVFLLFIGLSSIFYASRAHAGWPTFVDFQDVEAAQQFSCAIGNEHFPKYAQIGPGILFWNPDAGYAVYKHAYFGCGPIIKMSGRPIYGTGHDREGRFDGIVIVLETPPGYQEMHVSDKTFTINLVGYK